MTVRRRLALIVAMACVTAGLVLAARIASAASPPPAPPTLVAVRAAHHSGFDRVVFEFAGPLPSRREVTYVPRLIADGSGRTIRIAGRAILRVVLFPAVAHGARAVRAGPTTFSLPNVITVVRAGDFESVVSYGISVAQRAPVRVSVLTHPSRVVIDVGTPFRTVLRGLYLFHPGRFAANRMPFFTRVVRPGAAATPATALMDRLFAGPTPGEHRAGLRFLSSRATGFADLRVTGGIAHVRLTGGCSSGGSTVTIAGEIIPTLTQLPGVRYVKIYDPSGHTERPTGPSDSVPFCLEP